MAHSEGLFKECGGNFEACVSAIVTATLLTGLCHAKPQTSGGTYPSAPSPRRVNTHCHSERNSVCVKLG